MEETQTKRNKDIVMTNKVQLCERYENLKKAELLTHTNKHIKRKNKMNN